MMKLSLIATTKKVALPLPLAGEGWGGVAPRATLPEWREPHPALRADLRASFARLDPRRRER
jgi:hypothetical protein